MHFKYNIDTFISVTLGVTKTPFLLYNMFIPKEETTMRCEVKLYVAGRVFYEEVEARDYSDARDTALARNPKATVVSVNAKF